ncbi:MAG: tetratricopeptide repeat protein, partial [Methanophagales archaeon]|nr:tetratricopeptide repeat protein [Methanophagales archaeon]
MDYDAVSIFNLFGSEEKFNEVLIELEERGMLFRDEKSSKFDLHPIVRKYCYDRLKDKKSIHLILEDYFALMPGCGLIPDPEEKINSVEDLVPLIEFYYHIVRAGRYETAMVLYYHRLHYALYYKFGEYQTIIELLRALFPDGEDKLPKLREDYLAWTLNSLGVSYSISGQSRWAKPLFKKQITIREKRGEKKNLVTGLGNLAGDQILTGEFDAAEANLRRVIEIGRGIKDVFEEAVGHRDLGLLLTYRGKFEESENELISALELLTKSDFAQSQCVLWTYHSSRALLMLNADEVLKYALKACELADVKHHVRDIIRVEYFLGAAHLMKGNFV